PRRSSDLASGVSGFEEGTPEEEAWWAEKMAPVQAAIEEGDLELAMDLRVRAMWALLGTDDPPGARIRRIAPENRPLGAWAGGGGGRSAGGRAARGRRRPDAGPAGRP